MKRYVTSILFTLVIVLLYHFVGINLFSFDLPKKVRDHLFNNLRPDPSMEEDIIIADIGYMKLEEVKEKLEVIKSFDPKSIGVNFCNMKETNEELNDYLSETRNIITCDCDLKSDKRSSWILDANNEVTHFLSGKDTYFEQQLLGGSAILRERGNDKEIINYRATELYPRFELSKADSINPDFVRDRIVIVGFLRDSLITPMNEWYGRSADEINGDMSDAQISANIIATIKNNEFIDEANSVVRMAIILFIGLLSTLLLRLVRSRYGAVNILLAVLFFVGLNMLSTMLMAYLFAAKNYYLNLDEVTAVLFFVSAASLYWNTRDNETRISNSDASFG